MGKRKSSKKAVIAFDPCPNRVGWAVVGVKKSRPVYAVGVFDYDKFVAEKLEDDYSLAWWHRWIRHEMAEVMMRHYYDFTIVSVGVEIPTGGHNVKSSMDTAYAAQSTIDAADDLLSTETPPHQVKPSEWKKHVGLKGNCRKDDVFAFAAAGFDGIDLSGVDKFSDSVAEAEEGTQADRNRVQDTIDAICIGAYIADKQRSLPSED